MVCKGMAQQNRSHSSSGSFRDRDRRGSVPGGHSGKYRLVLRWQLHKDNGTDSDHFRKGKIVGIPRKLVNTVSGTHTALDRANLPAKTADNVLALLPQSRQLAAAKAVDIQGLLGESRHTHNSDIRARIQEVLLYLAKEKGIQVPQNLLDWQSDPKDTATSVD
jgi:hypothetical protein